MLKFLDGRFFVPLLVIAYGVILWGLREYGLGPRDTFSDTVLIGFFLLLSGVLWILDILLRLRRRRSVRNVLADIKPVPEGAVVERKGDKQ